MILRTRTLVVSLMAACAVCLPACSTSPLEGMPIELVVKQRSTTAVPGAEGIELTIDDITRGQTIVSLAGPRGATLLAPVSMRAGDAAPFTFDGNPYCLTLDVLNNALLGADSARFVITSGTAAEGPSAAKVR